MAFMFDEVQYEQFNDMEIDRSRNIDITSLMKDYATFSNEIAYSLHKAGFIVSSDTVKSLTDDGYFNFCAQHIVGLLRGLQTCDN